MFFYLFVFLSARRLDGATPQRKRCGQVLIYSFRVLIFFRANMSTRIMKCKVPSSPCGYQACRLGQVTAVGNLSFNLFFFVSGLLPRAMRRVIQGCGSHKIAPLIVNSEFTARVRL